MKIQFDHQIFSLQQYGGISRYFSVLQDYIQDQRNMTMDRGLLVSRNNYLSESVYPMPAKLARTLVSRSRTYSFNKRYSKFLLEKGQFDVFHPTYYDAYFLPVLKKPFVLTVHDMTHELFPEFFPVHDKFITYKRKVIERADHVIAVSTSTRNDLQHIFGIDERKVSVVHHGFYNGNIEAAVDFNPIPNPFILFVGDRSGYKNFTRFITGITPLLHKDKELFVICAGGGGFNLSERELLHRNRITENIIQLPVTDSQLKTLYQKTMLFVYPSLYEGFGLPMLEAFSNDCPAAVSRTSCFPEVGGEAAVYFDPYEPDDILQAIQSVIHNKEYRLLLSQKAEVQLQHFTLDSCMEKTMDIYRELGKN
ncbi:MAG: glycosyltransferase family 1 protein [Anditalea sp.]